MTTNKEIAKLHFITLDHPDISHADQAIRAYKAGCKWVQLRMKDSSEEEIEQEIIKILPVANAHQAILLINDNAELTLKTGAHGVHLGKNDMCPAEARKLLGPDFIIGGTANTLEDILSLIERGVDYVGLGPFRFTTTKKKLSPTLGRAGYDQILSKLKSNQLNIPVIAIGGILENDIESLKQTGIHGIAVGGAIVAGNAIETNIQNYQQLIHS
ncbi:MAG TPA: thiamine phosphate synthase [Paludibacter sp.]|nr:thiamine phosphate synthase [Paludibacter sp.]